MAAPPFDATAFAAWLAGPHHDVEAARRWAAASAGHVVDCAAVPRLPLALLAVCTPASAPRLGNLAPLPRAAVLTLGLGGCLGVTATADERKTLDTLPFAAQVAADAVRIALPVHGERRPGYGSAAFHQWAGGITGGPVLVDLGSIDHINSVVIAWLLQLVQSARPMAVEVRNAKPGVSTQLRQLRLDHLLRLA